MANLHPTVQPLPWDSNFFGWSVGLLTTQQGPEQSAIPDQDYRLLYYYGRPEELPKSTWLDQYWMEPVAGKVTYTKTATAGEEETSPARVHSFQADSPTEELYALAYDSGIYSRFATDPNIPTTKFQEMYRMWMDKSVARTLADEVFVVKDEVGRVIGMLTLRKRLADNQASIGLVAVATAARGQGVATRLMAATEQQTCEWGLHQVSVVTQSNNLPARRLYEKAGYTVQEELPCYHLWKKT